MKKIKYIAALVIALLLMSFSSFGNNFEIKFAIKNLVDSTAYVTIFGAEGAIKYNPITIKKGSFVFSGTATEPAVARISFAQNGQFDKIVQNGFIPTKSASLWVIVYPGAKFGITGDFKGKDFVDVYPQDGKENTIFARLNCQMMPLLNASVNLARKKEMDKSLSAEQLRSIAERSMAINGELDVVRKNFIRENASSVAALWLMEDMLIRQQVTIDLLDSLLPSVNNKYHNGYFYKAVKNRVDGAKSTKIGAKCVNITGTLPAGGQFSLESLKGKFVIIDFWGTWCSPCMKGVPHMKEFRDKHVDMLEIVGIAQDENVQKWASAIEANKMNWPNVMNGKDGVDYVAMFNVQGFPTKILLGPDGEILHRESGERVEFYDLVEKFLSSKKALKKEKAYVNVMAKNYQADYLEIVVIDQGETVRARVNLKDGVGAAELLLSGPQRGLLFNYDPVHNIVFDKGYAPPSPADFFIAPGETIELSFDNKEWPLMDVTGGMLNETYHPARVEISTCKREERGYIKKSFALKDSDVKEKQECTKQRERLNIKQQAIVLNLIKSNPQSFLAIYFLDAYKETFGIPVVEEVLMLLRPHWSEHSLFKGVEEKIAITKHIVVGALAPHFIKKDKDGKEVQLSRFKGKYVLIDFWGTWCAPCRTSHPHLVSLYKEYASKGVEFVNVASEGKSYKRDKWLSVIEEDGLVWTQILNEEDIDQYDLVKLFNVSGFPTKILLDKEGKILVIEVGGSDQIDAMLKSIL